MGYLVKDNILTGVAKDIETIIKLRPWIEEEVRKTHGYTGKTKLFTEYDKESELFAFSILFEDEPRN